MTEDLQAIYNKGNRRPIGPSAWYKQPTRGASCPIENRNFSVSQFYTNSFRCISTDTVQERERKMNAAKACASERMADMYVLLKQGHTIHKPHIYPIKLAYRLGKECATLSGKDTDVIDYDKDFENWYEQLRTQERPHIMNSVFRKGNLTSNSHPLLGFSQRYTSNTTRRSHRAPQKELSNPVTKQLDNGWQQVVSTRRRTGTGAGVTAFSSTKKANKHGNTHMNDMQRGGKRKTRKHKIERC